MFATLAVIVAATAFAQQPPPERQQPPTEQKQTQQVQGELVQVDDKEKMLTVKPATGDELQIAYDDKTEISGAKGAAGLATMKNSRVTVHFSEDAQTNKKLATRIIVEAPK